MAWLLAIFFIPFLGVILFLLIGSPKLSRKRRKRQAEINAIIKERTNEFEEVHHRITPPEWFPAVVNLNRNIGAMPLTGGNTMRIQIDYEQNILDMAADIDTATSYVHVEYYILSYDSVTKPFFDALERAVQRGVTVRVLLDHVAALRTVGYKETKRHLTAIGAEWNLMLPFLPFEGKYERPDLRNHRKILVIDGAIGWMGSQNIIDSSYLKKGNIKRGLHWKDAQVRMEGRIVPMLNAIFSSDWFSETNTQLDNFVAREVEARPGNLQAQLVPSGPGFATENNLRLFLDLLYNAKEKVIITSPYFVPDESMMYAITTAVQRGVHVELFVSEIGDQALVYHAQRSYYEELLRVGVHIWLYQAPTILHSKHMSIDDNVAVIGSSNMDIRSFSLNMEIMVLVRGSSFVKQMREVEAEYRAHSRPLTKEEWKQQSFWSTTLDGLARLTSALQ